MFINCMLSILEVDFIATEILWATSFFIIPPKITSNEPERNRWTTETQKKLMWMWKLEVQESSWLATYCDRILLNTQWHIKWRQFPLNKIMQAFPSNKESHKSIFHTLKSVGKFCPITVNSKSNWKEFPPRQRVEFVDGKRTCSRALQPGNKGSWIPRMK